MCTCKIYFTNKQNQYIWRGCRRHQEEITINISYILQVPDDAFNSVDKLASYLSGTAKKSELEDSKDADDTENSKLPPPLPAKTNKKDIVSDPSVFKHIDENARNVSIFTISFYSCHIA